MSTKAERAAVDLAVNGWLHGGREDRPEEWTRLGEAIGYQLTRFHLVPFGFPFRTDDPRGVGAFREGLKAGLARGRAERLCRRCGYPYVPKRSDSRYCSGGCRVAAHRANLRAPIRMLD